VIATAVVHSAVNLVLIRMFQRSPLLTELALLLIGVATLGLGVAVLR